MCMTPNNWERCVEFHGHSCPGLAIGYRACEAADGVNPTYVKLFSAQHGQAAHHGIWPWCIYKSHGDFP